MSVLSIKLNQLITLVNQSALAIINKSLVILPLYVYYIGFCIYTNLKFIYTSVHFQCIPPTP